MAVLDNTPRDLQEIITIRPIVNELFTSIKLAQPMQHNRIKH